MVLAVAFLVAACGGDDGPTVSDECGFADRLLPFEAGYSWEYRVTDLSTGVRTTKMQSLGATPVTDPAFPGEMFIEQTTIKANGQTVSKLKLEGDAIIRFVQEDFDDVGDSERVTIYMPGKLRLDEAAARLTVGTTFTENYTATVTETGGTATSTDITESWEVISESSPCTSPLGNFDCTVIRRSRTVGGTSTKDFHFAKGIGKVREEGLSQLEEVVGCM